MLFILLFFFLHWYSSLFMQTFLQHRYASHAAFTMNKFWERFFYIVAYITQGSSYLSPRVYAIMHRMHHAYTDTDKDPHSPSFDSSIFAMMKKSRDVSNGIFKHTLPIEQRFTKNLPDWPLLDKIGHSLVSRLTWCVLYILLYIHFAPNVWWFLLVPVHILMVPIQGVIINWFAHKYGSVNFSVKNTSTNLFKVDVLMMGEAYHNNHHKSPSSSNFGFKWHEVDPTYFIMRFLNKLSIIKMHKAITVVS
jgi:stearoyl-CoA desaturase (Delta-9 desaturase)